MHRRLQRGRQARARITATAVALGATIAPHFGAQATGVAVGQTIPPVPTVPGLPNQPMLPATPQPPNQPPGPPSNFPPQSQPASAGSPPTAGTPVQSAPASKPAPQPQPVIADAPVIVAADNPLGQTSISSSGPTVLASVDVTNSGTAIHATLTGGGHKFASKALDNRSIGVTQVRLVLDSYGRKLLKRKHRLDLTARVVQIGPQGETAVKTRKVRLTP